MSRLAVVLVLALFAACGSSAAAPDASVDAEPCGPTIGCGWLEGYQRAVVGKLAGAEEIAPGVTLAHRQSIAERATVRTYLLAELTALGYQPEERAYQSGKNVVARLEPTTGGAASLLVVGAHFDGVLAGPAAADNATGVAVVLAAARYLRDTPVRTHPIELALFDEEEDGLYGSTAYAAALTAAGTPVQAAHCYDMLSFDGDGDHAVELWSPTPGLTEAYQAMGTPLDIPIGPVTFKFSDHQAFLDAGFAATGIGEEFVADDHTPHYHKATDTFDKIDFAYLGRATLLAFAVLEAAASAP